MYLWKPKGLTLPHHQHLPAGLVWARCINLCHDLLIGHRPPRAHVLLLSSEKFIHHWFRLLSIHSGKCRRTDERDRREDEWRDRRDRRSPPPTRRDRYPSDRDRWDSSRGRDESRDWKRRRFSDAPVPVDRRAEERAARWQAEVGEL